MNKKELILHVGVLKIKWGHVFGICEALTIKGWKWPWGEVRGVLVTFKITNIYILYHYIKIF